MKAIPTIPNSFRGKASAERAGWFSWCRWVYFLAMAGVQSFKVTPLWTGWERLGNYGAWNILKLLNLSNISLFQRGNLEAPVEHWPIFCHPHALQPATLSSHPRDFRWGLPVWVTLDFWPWGLKVTWTDSCSKMIWGHRQTRFFDTVIVYIWRFDAWFVLRTYVKGDHSLLQVHRVWGKTSLPWRTFQAKLKEMTGMFIEIGWNINSPPCIFQEFHSHSLTGRLYFNRSHNLISIFHRWCSLNSTSRELKFPGESVIM